MTAALSSADSNRSPLAPLRRSSGLAWTSVALSIAMVLATIGFADARKVIAELAAIDTRWLSVAFLLGLAQVGVLGLRWSRVAAELGVPIGWLKATAEYALSMLGNQVLPSGIAGDGLRAVRHARRNGDGSLLPALEALTLDRASGQLALWLVVLVTAPVAVRAGIAAPAAIAVGGTAVALALGLVCLLAARVPRLRRLVGRSETVIRRALGLLFTPRGAAIHLPLSLIFVACMLLQLYVAARAIGVVLPFASLLWLGPLILVASSVPSFFGGWGIREGASALLFAAAGLPESTGIAVSMVYGTFSLVISLPGFVVLLFDEGRPRPSEAPAWTYASALSMVLGTLLALWLDYLVPLAVIALLCFFVFVAQARGGWTPKGVFGLPNVVTTGRLFMSVGMLLGHARQPGVAVAGMAVLNLLLDVVDGWLARRTGQSSEFGARYDVETDALLVLTLSVLLFTRGIAGSWVIVAGLWRYLYVLAPVCFPTPQGEAPRSRYGRFFYVFMVASFVLAFLVPGAAGGAFALAGTVAVSISFVHSFWQRYAPAGIA